MANLDETQIARLLRRLPPAPQAWMQAVAPGSAEVEWESEPAIDDVLVPDVVAHLMESGEALPGRSVENLLESLADERRTPGAGLLAGLTAALAASVVEMVARVSRPVWREAPGVQAQAELLGARALRLAQDNETSYGRALTLLGAPQGENRELGNALSRAADVPLEIAEAAADLSSLARSAWEAGDQAVRADAAAAAALAAGAAQAAAGLVEANLLVSADDARGARARGLARAAADEVRATVRA